MASCMVSSLNMKMKRPLSVRHFRKSTALTGTQNPCLIRAYFRKTNQLCDQGTGRLKRVITFSAAFRYQE